MNNQEDIVTYEQAIILKKIGFDWECKEGWVLNGEKKWVYQPCPAYWHFLYNCEDKTISAPTQSQASKWLRVKHNLFVHVYLHLDDCWRYEIQCIFNHENYMYEPDAGLWWRSYEQALSAGIDKAIKQ